MLRYLNGNKSNFIKTLELILEKRKLQNPAKLLIVKNIIKDVKKKRDLSVIKYEKKFSKKI